MSALLGLLLLLVPWVGANDSEGAPSLAELRVQLTEREPARRRRAVRELAALGGREAWQLVLAALADPKGEVADEAQLRLAGLDEPKLLRGLLGRDGLGSKEPWVRRRVAEALGRMSLELPAEKLVLAVQRKDPESAELVLWSVERLAREGRIAGDLGRCARELERLAERRGPPRLRAQALCALAQLEDERAAALALRMRRERDPLLRAAGLEVALLVDADGGLAACRDLVEDEALGVRVLVLRGLRALGTRTAAELLIDRLEVESRARLRLEAHEALQDLSGLKHRLDPRPWRHWLKGVEEGFVPRRGGATLEPRTSATLAGLPILSDRLCILVDFSGSLWYERDGRPPRKSRVDALLRETLPRLPEGTWFNLIPYTGEPHPWRDALVPATKRNVRAALADFEAADMRGSGDAFEALRLALRDPDVDRLLLFTDGAPTGGEHWSLELMVPLLEQAARWRGVAYDCVLVDTPPGLARRWEELCRRTGGRAKRVEL